MAQDKFSINSIHINILSAVCVTVQVQVKLVLPSKWCFQAESRSGSSDNGHIEIL